jgi:hypothetical protein
MPFSVDARVAMRYSDLTVSQQAYIDCCIAYEQFRILESIARGAISRHVASYGELLKYVDLNQHGFVERPEEIEEAKTILSDEPGQASGTKYLGARALIRNAIDEWLRETSAYVDQPDRRPPSSH